MPEDMMLFSLIIPAILCVILKGAKWEAQLLSFAINFSAMLYTMFAYDLTISLLGCLIFVPVCLILMYENRRQNVALYLLSRSQESLVVENERLAAETHANELRHMIGNVAHDLKTVIVSSVFFILLFFIFNIHSFSP